MEMMTGRTLFRNYKEYDQKEVEICGWVKSNRGSKKFGFLVINDGTFFEPIQVVYDQEMGNFDTVSKLNVGTAVIVNGTVIVTPDAKQPFEIHANLRSTVPSISVNTSSPVPLITASVR